MRYSFIAIVLFSKVLISSAQTSKPDTIITCFTLEPVQLDGKLDEPVWQQAMHISNFTQRELNVNEPATERTEVAIVYTSKTLYIGFWGYDREPDKLVAREMKRDFSWGQEDNFELIIDTYNDDRNGFLFVINPNAARADAQMLDNGVWNARTIITDQGWFAEIETSLNHWKPERTTIVGKLIWRFVL